jgi:L-ascorbate metabolism protein UlaG (beta-lactamase superfamily)
MTVLNNDQIIVRINGVLPEISALGNEDKSERAAEIKRTGMTANTSCSIFAKGNKTTEIFHILVDIGEGVIKSMEKGYSDIGFSNSTMTKSSSIPDAILITHAHNDHIKELPILLNKVDDLTHLKILCTKECSDQIINKFLQLSKAGSSRILFNILQAGETFVVGPFSITPILANHGENSSAAGSVIYILTILDRKIIIGWDFLSLSNANENLLWNPDLLILGTETYNPHPETGMISVTEAYDLVRRWNAKECYIVHYSGLKDFEEATNQWFRGPVKAMTTDELQNVIDSHLKISGADGKFRIVVAKEGMVWKTSKKEEEQHQLADENSPIGRMLEIESLQKYVLKFEKGVEDNKLKLIIEDQVNRLSLEFSKLHKDRNSDDVLYAEPVKAMMSKGPELRMEIILQPQEASIIRINIFRGKKKKDVFKDDILIKNIDAQRLKRYIKENFIADIR